MVESHVRSKFTPIRLAPAVEYRRAGVAACGMVVRKEADGNGRAAVDLHAPASVVLGGDDVAEPLRDVVVVNFRIVLFQNTFDSGVGLVIYSVGIPVAAYLAVSHAQREVGIGIEGTLRIPFAQTLDIGRVEFVQALAVQVAGRALAQFIENAGDRRPNIGPQSLPVREPRSIRPPCAWLRTSGSAYASGDPRRSTSAAKSGTMYSCGQLS